VQRVDKDDAIPSGLYISFPLLTLLFSFLPETNEYIYIFIFVYTHGTKKEFSKCMQEVKVSGGEETTCKLLGQDYLECLHHKRAATREKIIAEEEKRQQIQQDFRNANVLKTSAH
jgi:hypothetical protein